jgi:transcriptional regulator with AAA-type ATPase domain
MATDLDTPARSRFRTAVRRKSWKSLVGFFSPVTGSTRKNPAAMQAVSHDPRKSRMRAPSSQWKIHGMIWPVARSRAVVASRCRRRRSPKAGHTLNGKVRPSSFLVAPTSRRDLAHYLDVRGCASPLRAEAAHVFAGYYQVRRAFHHIHANILGESGPARRLRAAVWQSIFTRDGRRYRRALYARMGDVATLVTGPSGTGKELVARAIGLARYVPFDAETGAFAEPAAGAFFPLNLAALSPTLIESELFGHRRGAFTGAPEDRKGWFETCPPLGTVFLDEIGEVDAAIQVKLLRVLQTRTFQRLGDTADRAFSGKLIAATNRDLRQALAAGRFREDFYYRLCADLLVTPSLAERLGDTPGELRTLLRTIARRVAGDAEADDVAAEAEAWITAHLGPDYAWPGNVRELEQCVRNLVIRGSYDPQAPRRGDARAAFLDAVAAGALSADALLRRYCTWVYAQTQNYNETARRLGLDSRTVRDRVDPAWLAALRDGDGASHRDGPANPESTGGGRSSSR